MLKQYYNHTADSNSMVYLLVPFKGFEYLRILHFHSEKSQIVHVRDWICLVCGPVICVKGKWTVKNAKRKLHSTEMQTTTRNATVIKCIDHFQPTLWRLWRFHRPRRHGARRKGKPLGYCENRFILSWTTIPYISF